MLYGPKRPEDGPDHDFTSQPDESLEYDEPAKNDDYVDGDNSPVGPSEGYEDESDDDEIF